MWKIIVAFVLFAAVALWMLSKGPDIDMSGEKHGVDAHAPAGSEAHGAAPAASAAVEAASAAVDAASAAASAASN
jgi:hypothetical protein